MFELFPLFMVGIQKRHVLFYPGKPRNDRETKSRMGGFVFDLPLMPSGKLRIKNAGVSTDVFKRTSRMKLGFCSEP